MAEYRFTACRDRSHAWFTAEEMREMGLAPQLPTFTHLGSGEWERTIECIKCHTLGRERFVASGRQTRGRRYGYVDGYLIPGERHNRTEFRRVAVKAALQALRRAG